MNRLKRQFSIFHLFTLMISNCFCKRSLKKPPGPITDIKSSHNFILFHKDLRSRIAISMAHNLNKDNLLYHNLSESKYLQPCLTNSENSKNFPFQICQNQPPKNVVFHFFKKRAVVSLPKISRSQIFVIMQERMSTFDIRYENGWFFHKIFGKSGQKVVKMKN